MEFWQEPFNGRLFEGVWTLEEKDLDHVTKTFRCNLASQLEEDPTEGPARAVDCGSNLLNWFCKLNWIGPLQSALQFPFPDAEALEKLNSQSLEALSWDGEQVYPLCRHPLLLHLAHVLLVDDSMAPPGTRGVWWTLRCLFVEQRVLSQRSATLWSKISHLIDTDIPQLIEGGLLSQDEKCELYLEMGHIALHYSQYESAKAHLASAQALAGLSLELSGAMGKRTRFQTKDTAQLVLSVTTTEDREEELEGGGEGEKTAKCLPKDLQLQDDTLLEHIAYTDPQATPTPPLTPLQQAVVLGQCICLRRSLPVDRLGNEETEAYIHVWCVQCFALFLRCQLERERRRTVERAMLQLQELVQDYHTHKDGTVLKLFYSLPLPPVWEVEKEYADTLASLGSVHSALEVYERLEKWEEVVECYKATGRGGKAETVVRDRMKRGVATPTLLCLLGDVTQDPECYCKAWEMSGGRSGRAQRSLGLYHLRRKEYKQCIPALELSLKINSLQEGVWFSLGCAALQVGDEEVAARAFHRCVTLEPDFAEAWNNLALIYLRRSEKVRAFHAYQEALKCSYDNQKIWENLLVVSTDVCEFASALQVYHRMLDLNSKYLDVEILRCLVSAVLEGRNDRSGQPASSLRKKLGELLGRITSQTTGSADVWEVYSDYHFSSEDMADREKGLLELQKAQRCARQRSGWDREWQGVERAAQLTLRYCQMCRKLSGERENVAQSLQSTSSAKLALQGIISKTKSFGVTTSEQQTQLLEKLESEMSSLVELLSQLNSDS